MTAPNLTDLQAATVGKQVQLPDGGLALVCREDITGTPAFVRNRLLEHRNAGTLLSKGELTYDLTPRGYEARVSAIVLNTRPPGNEFLAALPRWSRHVARAVGGAFLLFGVAAVGGYWTGDDAARALAVPLAGMLAVLVGVGLLQLASLIASVCPGIHCDGCPDK